MWVNHAGVLRAGTAWELSDEQVALQADAAMPLLTGRRIVRSLPPSRAGLARVGGLLPRVGRPVSARLRAQGDRRRVADS